jgi:UDP-N-acetyl-D-glucosamine dehydrogenase
VLASALDPAGARPEGALHTSTTSGAGDTAGAGLAPALSSAPAAGQRPAATPNADARLTCGDTFFLAFSPEREDPGRKDFTTTTTPKVVGGVDELSGDLAQALYDQIITTTVRVSSARVAEASKLTENIFRAVNIALVNELKVVYDRMGIDVWEVLDAASTKPFGFTRFNPGPGWGGHCIPLDPFYLSWKAKESGEAPKFIELAGDVNVRMPRYVVEKLQLALNEREKSVKGSHVLVLGIAYKKDIDDPRESPAFEVIEELLRLGAVVSYHDPHIPVAPRMRSWPDLPTLTSNPLTAETLAATDAVIVVTDHAAVDYDLVAEHASLVVDTRGVYRAPRPNVVKA